MVEQPHALPRGYEFDGYRIDSVLGTGGFGITYRARETTLRRRVAIKEYLPSGFAVRDRDGVGVMPASDGDEENFAWGLRRFRQEAETLASFQHPNIVPVHRFLELNGTAYMIMQYEDGESLAEIIDRDAPLMEREIRSILDPLLDGLAEVHRQGIYHRDIKPANIYVREDGTPVLLDFGAARHAIGARSRSLYAIVAAGFTPIEQYAAETDPGPWTDVYATGATAYAMMAGRPPPDAIERSRQPGTTVPAVTVGAERYDEAFLRAIDWALAVMPEDRPQSIEDWRGAMPDAVDQQPVVADESVTIVDRGAPPRATRQTAHSSRILWLGTAAAALVLMAGGGYFAFSDRPGPAPAQTAETKTAETKTAETEPAEITTTEPESAASETSPPAETAPAAPAQEKPATEATADPPDPTPDPETVEPASAAPPAPPNEEPAPQVAAATEPPKQLSPRDGIKYDRDPPIVTLSWARVPGAQRYRYEVHFYVPNDGWFANFKGKPYRNLETQETKATFEFLGAQPGRWRVQALFADGSGPWSGWRRFEFLREVPQ